MLNCYHKMHGDTDHAYKLWFHWLTKMYNSLSSIDVNKNGICNFNFFVFLSLVDSHSTKTIK